MKLIEMVVEPTLIFNHLIIDTGKRKVYYNQQEVLLTTKEYELLYRLALYEGRVLSYRQLYEAVWGEDPMGNEANAVSCHVYGLRRKFREIALSFAPYTACSYVKPSNSNWSINSCLENVKISKYDFACPIRSAMVGSVFGLLGSKFFVFQLAY